VIIRKATVNDIPEIREIINYHAKKEMMLPRSLSELYECTRSFYLCEVEDEIVGCCALQVSWEKLAEVISLAVKPGYEKKGIGTLLVDRATQEALVFNISQLFVLTYQPSFFERFNFTIIDREQLPRKIWSDCMFCVKFPDCDETAMLKKLHE